jgi:2-polyprenyl-3-methyl-5-hydroxy-6-metoxy-1,4-benzoquinol methylase
VAGAIAESFFFNRGKRLYEANSKDWLLSLSKIDKLWAGGFIILKDYSEGRFPPVFEDQARAYAGEVNFCESMPGVTLAENLAAQGRKPFWGPVAFAKYSRDFTDLLAALEQIGLKPGSRLLELGCGTGWMAEFLALSGYPVVGTSIAPSEIALAEKRVEGLKARGMKAELSFKVAPMESVDAAWPEPPQFDGVFVFEALHHAFDWRKTIGAGWRCLKPGGWLLLANEPNLIHTFVSYRVARLSNTHEIGMSRKEIVQEMKRCGFKEVRVLKPKFDNWIAPHWIAARK